LKNDERFLVTKASSAQITKIQNIEREAMVNRNIGEALKRVKLDQKWNKERLEGRILGIKPSFVMRYFQPSFSDRRQLHVLAYISWLIQIPMAALYYGKELKRYWSFNEGGYEVLVSVAQLSTRDFDAFVNFLSRCNLLVENEQRISQILDELSQYEDALFIAPKEVNIWKLGVDYYRSTGMVLKRIRIVNEFMIEEMASVLGVSPEIYQRYEALDPGVQMRSEIGHRAFEGFNLRSSALFLDYMKEYKGLRTARQVQERRAEIISLTWNSLKSKQEETMVSSLAQSMMGCAYLRV